jgi:hypothetical protein
MVTAIITAFNIPFLTYLAAQIKSCAFFKSKATILFSTRNVFWVLSLFIRLKS